MFKFCASSGWKNIDFNMDVEELEVEAKATAAKHVSNMLQRPDQLEKVDQYKRRVVRKKASVEAMLKTAMQSQLDGVRTGLTQLETAWQDIQVLQSNFTEIQEQFEMVPKLKVKLQDVREESLKHSQYAAAMENLKHIFTVPESVERTKNWINDKKFLYAHQSLTDLENSRDDLLFELHKLPNQSPTDRNMLKQYFADVEKLSDALGEQLWFVLKRCLDCAIEEPTALVTAMRIIEREEKADKMCEDRLKQSGYMPTGRPKKWRYKSMNVLENVVQIRIETVPLKERADDKMWLVLHLETLRLLIIDDLKIVKKMCMPCFPPHYNIFDKFVQMYHNTLSKRLLELSKKLEGNEYASMLAWVNIYKEPEIMGDPDLNIDVSTLSPLLDNFTVNGMIDHYCTTIKNNFRSWMENTLRTDFQDWVKDVEPEETSDGYFHTPVPVILFQMIDQHLQLVKTVNNDLVNRVLDLSMKEIAIINNCLRFVDLAQQLRNGYYKVPDPTAVYSNKEADTASLNVLKSFLNLRDEAISFLLDEMFLDLEPHLLGLFTKNWSSSPIIVDTICVTLEDYCGDYTHLNKKNFAVSIKQAQDRVAVNYIKAMLQRKITLRNYEERKEFAEQIVRESNTFKELFNKLSRSQITNNLSQLISEPTRIPVPNRAGDKANALDLFLTSNPNIYNTPKIDSSIDKFLDFKTLLQSRDFLQVSYLKRLVHILLTGQTESPFEALPMMVEVVKLKDPNMVSLEVMGLKKRYEDVSIDQLTALLTLRGDISRSDSRQLVIDVIPKETGDRRPSNPMTSIFSQITVQF
ncbi:Exocyst complex component 3 [Nymphon striatum]|nr:Exocyst complex component 3 [Nymphon striatum]